jgi:hypothetical protein
MGEQPDYSFWLVVGLISGEDSDPGGSESVKKIGRLELEPRELDTQIQVKTPA